MNTTEKNQSVFDKWRRTHVEVYNRTRKERQRLAWNAAVNYGLEIFDLSNADLFLMAGEMTAQELRTVQAVLKALKHRMEHLIK